MHHFFIHHLKRKALVRTDYSHLNRLGFDSEEEDRKEATGDMDPSVGDVRLQNPSSGDVTGELMPEEMDKELQALAKAMCGVPIAENKLLLMRAVAQDLRHELEGEQNGEKGHS